MKYGRLIYGKSIYSKYNEFANIGDCIQSFSIDELYSLCGIAEEKTVSVKRECLSENVEETILPLQGYFTSIKGLTDIFPLPSNYIPLFIGYHDLFIEGKATKDKLDYLRNNAPIGCRDEGTYRKMIKYGIPAYISGCLSITLPIREKKDTQTKVFLVDAPNGIEKYLPDRLKKDIEYITHEVRYMPKADYLNNSDYIEQVTRDLLKRYRDEALLVVTSRLHCAAPCLGMGVPVILTRKYFDDRYAWIDKYLKLYTPDMFSEIDWNIGPVDLSKEKQILVDLFRSIISKDSLRFDTLSAEIDAIYASRGSNNIKTPMHVRVYKKLLAKNPQIADFIREKVLHSFSIATGRDK